jgi:S1-C subfamily serine protease
VSPALFAVALLVIGMGAGFGLGRFVWPTRGSGSARTSTTLPTFGFPFGGSTFPFGSGSSGATSSAKGSPSDPAAIAAKVDPALVDVDTTLGYQSEMAAGTGIVLSSNGEILTNNHVIDGATNVSVTDIGNGQVYSATVVGYDRARDVAVLQVNGASGLKVASFAPSAKVRVGEPVVGIGNAGGAGGTPSVAGGSVTAINQSITATEHDGGNPENLTGLIEVNSDIQAGDSGGPLVNAAGKVIGLDTAASTGFSLETPGTQGYAIPIGPALAVAKQIESGRSSANVHVGPTAFLGVEVLPAPSGSSSPGALVHAVVAGSPAAKAGLMAGDSITALGGVPVGSPSELVWLMQLYRPGVRVQVNWRNAAGGQQNAVVQLVTGPAA